MDGFSDVAMPPLSRSLSRRIFQVEKWYIDVKIRELQHHVRVKGSDGSACTRIHMQLAAVQCDCVGYRLVVGDGQCRQLQAVPFLWPICLGDRTCPVRTWFTHPTTMVILPTMTSDTQPPNMANVLLNSCKNCKPSARQTSLAVVQKEKVDHPLVWLSIVGVRCVT